MELLTAFDTTKNCIIFTLNKVRRSRWEITTTPSLLNSTKKENYVKGSVYNVMLIFQFFTRVEAIEKTGPKNLKKKR